MNHKIVATSYSGERVPLTARRTGETFSVEPLKGVQFFDDQGNMAENLERNQVRLFGQRYNLPLNWCREWF